jgi:hypothetical protein
MSNFPRQLPEDHSPEGATLHPLDERALDWLVDHGFGLADLGSAPPELKERIERLSGSMAPLASYAVAPPSETLVDATLARIVRADAGAERGERMRIERAPVRLRSFRLPELIAVAAVLFLGVGVLFPMAQQLRSSSAATLCSNSLRKLGSAMHGYAADNAGSAPAMAGLGSLFSPAGNPTPEDLSRHHRSLDALVHKGYCVAGCTKCNGARTYSYRVATHPRQLRLAVLPATPIVSDANPLVDAMRRGQRDADASANSSNHGSRGQNVLFTDGSTVWTTTPMFRDPRVSRLDNMWLFQLKDGSEGLELRQMSRRPSEVFLAH